MAPKSACLLFDYLYLHKMLCAYVCMYVQYVTIALTRSGELHFVHHFVLVLALCRYSRRCCRSPLQLPSLTTCTRTYVHTHTYMHAYTARHIILLVVFLSAALYIYIHKYIYTYIFMYVYMSLIKFCIILVVFIFAVILKLNWLLLFHFLLCSHAISLVTYIYTYSMKFVNAKKANQAAVETHLCTYKCTNTLIHRYQRCSLPDIHQTSKQNQLNTAKLAIA